MRQGRIQQIDTPARVYAQPSNMFVAGFLGSPSMNFVAGRIAARDGSLRFESPALRLDLAGYGFTQAPRHDQPVVLGVRPESLALLEGGDPAARMQAAVSLIEPMGAQQIVWPAF